MGRLEKITGERRDPGHRDLNSHVMPRRHLQGTRRQETIWGICRHIITIETNPTTSEGTKKSQMEFGYHISKCSRNVGPTKMLQVTFAVRMCLPTMEELLVYRVQREQGLGEGSCIDCSRERAMLLLPLSLNIPGDQT